MGDRGPTPKRDAQRRRSNDPAGGPAESAPGASEVPVPPVDPGWHPVAIAWFESLARSGQSAFYEPSDWGLASVIAESMSRELNPQPIVIGKGEGATVEMHKMAPKGASLAAWLKAMSGLMVTEGDRRRVRLELYRPTPSDEEGTADVLDLDEFTRRLRESG